MADFFGFLQTTARQKWQDAKVIPGIWTQELQKLGKFQDNGKGRLEWLPYSSTKEAVIDHIFGKNVKYYIQTSTDPYVGTEVFKNDKIRISYNEFKYSGRDRDYLYDVLINRHRLGTLGSKGEKWFQSSLPQNLEKDYTVSSDIDHHEFKKTFSSGTSS